MNLCKELLHLAVEGGSAYHHLLDAASESLHEHRAHAGREFGGYSGEMEEHAHERTLKHGEHRGTNHLLQHERHRRDHARAYLAHGLHYDTRRGGAGKECDVTAPADGEEKLNRKSVHMRQRQNAHHGVAGLKLRQSVGGENHIAPQHSVREHDALAEARRAACIIDKHEVGALGATVGHIVRSKAFRITMAEKLVQMCAGHIQGVTARKKLREVGNA